MRQGIGSAEAPLRVAVVGAGPAGFYTAEALLDSGVAVEVDLLEQLPVPYGLVRYGVAPDHARLKSVTAVFAQIAQRPGLRFHGDVALGDAVSAQELGALYDAVAVCTGIDGDQPLGIEGEALPGVHAARDLVAWYNSRPGAQDLAIDLSQEVAVIVGQGNVAIDLCRILASPVDRLRGTDIAEHALQALAHSRLREIHLVGRRGPVQARFTPKELRELGTLPGWHVAVDPVDLQLGAACQAEAADPAAVHAARNLAQLQAYAAQPAPAGARLIRLHFHTAPLRLLGPQRLRAVELQPQRLDGPAGRQRAVPAGPPLRLPAGLLLRSVGYRGRPLPGLPFEALGGTLPQAGGRLLEPDGSVRGGWYAAGWVKRGASGVIGSNRACAAETVASLLADLPQLAAARGRRGTPAGRDGLAALLRARGRSALGFDAALAIEQAERVRGAATGKAAEKFICLDQMRAAARPL